MLLFPIVGHLEIAVFEVAVIDCSGSQLERNKFFFYYSII